MPNTLKAVDLAAGKVFLRLFAATRTAHSARARNDWHQHKKGQYILLCAFLKIVLIQHTAN